MNRGASLFVVLLAPGLGCAFYGLLFAAFVILIKLMGG